ncbi:MAG TPA: class I adenylate-forming enzyme family protein [Bdellovibrionota bacterium]|jgi:acyl-CoA synthetase (AMP-forming)/AMP-acid ligase II
MILTQAFHEAMAGKTGQQAVIDRNRSVTYSELRARVGRLSNFYQKDLPHGTRVAMLASNSDFFAQTLLALSNSGNPVLLLDPKDTDESIVTDLRNLQIKNVLVTNDQVFRMSEMIRRDGLALSVGEIEKRRAGEYDNAFQPLPDRPLRDTDPVLIIRQVDSSSDRAYCFFSHKQVLASHNSFKRFYRFTSNDRMLTTMHWSHPFALTHGLLLPLFSGAGCVVDPQIESVEEFVDYLAERRITRFAGPPKFYFQLLSYCAAKKYTLPGVKSITVGMGTISLALRKTYKLLKIPVLRCYGRTEAVWTLAMDELESALDIENARSKPGMGVRLSVLSEDGDEIPGPDRREGRLAVMTEAMAPTYFHPERKIAERRNAAYRGTWLKTDDVARLEGEGQNLTVAVLGKTYDMLFKSGEYLSPRRIDEAARKLEGVADAAGFVRFDKRKESSFALAVVSAGPKLNEKDLLDRLKEELTDEYVPETVHIMDAIPRDTFDSVNRLSLQRQFSAG